MNTPYTIAVTYHAKPGRRENFLRQLSAEGVIDTIRAERGCLRYDYYLSVQDADELLLVEQWATRADQQVHMGQSHMQTLLRIKEENVESYHVSEITLEGTRPCCLIPTRTMMTSASTATATRCSRPCRSGAWS